MYTIYGNSSYQIDNNFLITRKDGEPHGLKIKKGKVQIKLFGFLRTVDIKWLYYVAKLKIKMPNGYEEDLFKIEFKQTNLMTNIKIIAIFKEPVYYKNNNLEGFRLIARNPMYCINIKGDVYSIKHKKFLKPIYISQNMKQFNTLCKYPVVKIPNNVTIHRLVALTWIYNSDFKKYSMVDHIDGDKNNYNLSNLRWCSPLNNSQYTLEQNLRNDNIPVLVRNINTGEIKKFVSITKACEYIKISRINNFNQVNHIGKVWRSELGIFEIKASNDNTPWYYTENNKKLKSKQNTGAYVIFKNNGITKYYNSIAEASRELLSKYGRIAKMSPDIEKYIKEIYPNSTLTIIEKRKVQAMNIYTKSIIETNTILEMVEKLNYEYPKSTITKYIKNKRVLKDYVFRYKPFDQNEDWYIDTSETTYKSYPKIIVSKDIYNGNIVVFDSLRQAASYFHVDRNTIKNCINNNKYLRNQYELKFKNCHH